MHALPAGQFQFNEVRNLGIGGFGRVDEIVVRTSSAFGFAIGSHWAVKRLNDSWDREPLMVARFEREIVAVKSMDHPNVMACAGENLPGGCRFYVMPLYAHSLRTFIAEGQCLGDWRLAARIGRTLAGALQYAHERGFIHRDVKPENILYDGIGGIVLGDWGLGYFVHKRSKVLQHLTRGGMGTEYYCSLEQWNTGKCDERGDIYSLGMTLDEFVTGCQRVIQVGVGINSAAVAGVCPGSRRFNDLLRTMTGILPSHRPYSMAVVASEFAAIARM